VSSTGKVPDGSPVWGQNLKGLLIFTPDGHYSSQIMRSDRPKFSSNNRLQGTPDDYKAMGHGTKATFGKYTVDEEKKAFKVRFEGSTYPNNEGTSKSVP
jgi:Lipocalin-like domain